MESYLKTKKVRIPYLDKEFEIRELSTGAWIDLMEIYRNGGDRHAGTTVCKYGVVGWEIETVEDIEKSVPAKAMQELAEEIYALSGVDLEKNSESAPKEGSSSVSLRSLG
jgi:hypothetical protein